MYDGTYLIHARTLKNLRIISLSTSPIPTLDELRDHLELPTINTGKRISHTGSAGGVIYDDIEGLNLLIKPDGSAFLQSGQELFPYVYRGQYEEYKTCTPSLGRIESHNEQLKVICRNIAFDDLLGEHPYIDFCQRSSVLVKGYPPASGKTHKYPLSIDRQGMIQHYGFCTDLLDVTANFEVAAFFATCKKKGDGYQPIGSSTKPGVIYRLSPSALELSDDNNYEFRYLGWQPLSRPSEQRAFAIRIKKGYDFAQIPYVRKVKFRQDAKVSERIWNSFDQGKSLFPPEPVSKMAAQASSLTEFTLDQIRRAFTFLEQWNHRTYSSQDKSKIRAAAKLDIVRNKPLNWDSCNLERDELVLKDNLKKVLDKVNIRYASYGRQ